MGQADKVHINELLDIYIYNLSLSLSRNVQTYVQFHQTDQPLGIPSSNEIRLLLIEANGSHLAASKKCVANRKEKVIKCTINC